GPERSFLAASTPPRRGDSWRLKNGVSRRNKIVEDSPPQYSSSFRNWHRRRASLRRHRYKRVNEFESNIIWRTADLLGVSSRQRIELRQQVAVDRPANPVL
ncbi:MAG: hypothetical protein WCD30_17895, partial [Pseudolabrys sp.]